MELKRIIVGLDLTEMDSQIIRYVNYMNQVFDLEMIYFLHVARDLKLPEKIREKYPEMLAPVDESIEKEIDSLLEKEFKAGNTEYKIEIKEGDAFKSLMHWAEVKDVDLMVMGKKSELKGGGTLAYKFARLVHCSLLFVPEKSSPEISNVIVSSDFSEKSKRALDCAMYIREFTPLNIILHNAFEVPTGYHTTGKSFEEFKEIMRVNAQEDADNFLTAAGLEKEEVTVSLSFDDESDPGERAFECAEKYNADLIIIASHGRTGLASILLGSVAERMLRYDSLIPLLILKDKQENLGFFQALWRI